LSGEILESKTDHVSSSLGGGTVVDNSTIVENHDLVELIVNTFTSLVKGNKGSLVHDIGQKSKGFSVIKSSGSVKTSSRIVPRANGCTTTEHFPDGYSFPLSTGYTSNESVSDNSVFSVFDVEHRQEHSEDLFLELFVAETFNLSLGGLGVESESKSLTDSESREMIIVFLVVDYLTDRSALSCGQVEADLPSI
jgi:hypothetical protein